MGINRRLVILYGSQTGTAEGMSWQLRRLAKLRGVQSCCVMAMDSYNISDLLKEEIVVFICSTTGLGEEPDNMKKFWKFLLRKNLPANSLSHLNFGVLGLGDSSYSKFNYPAKKLNKRLLQLGAKQLLNLGLCDYQHDLGHDAVFDPWSLQLWDAINPYFEGVNLHDNQKIAASYLPKWEILRNVANIEEKEMKDLYFSSIDTNLPPVKPFFMSVKKNERTTSESHFQDVRLIEFNNCNGKFDKYKPGDVLNLRPKNCDEMVDAFFKLFEDHPLNLKPDDVIGIKQIDPGKYLFYIDIRTLNHRNLEKCNSGGLCSDVQISLKKSLDIL